MLDLIWIKIVQVALILVFPNFDRLDFYSCSCLLIEFFVVGIISFDERGQGVDSNTCIILVVLLYIEIIREFMLGRALSSLILETSEDGNLHLQWAACSAA